MRLINVTIASLLFIAPLSYAQEEEPAPAQVPITVPEQDEGLEREPPVTIRPNDNDRVESIRLANGKIRYKVTPKNGKPYCYVMERNDPFDPFNRAVTFRVSCD